MPAEIEAKVYAIDLPATQTLLRQLGARLAREGLQYRYTYGFPAGGLAAGERGFVRARQELDGQVRLACKRRTDGTLFFNEEEVTITEGLAAAHAFLSSLSLPFLSYAEQHRQQYTLPGYKAITIDTLPGLPPYLEVEAESPALLQAFLQKASCHQGQVTYGTYEEIYDHLYGVPGWLICLPDEERAPGSSRLSFATVGEMMRPFVQKNMPLFDEVAASQYKKWGHLAG